MRTNTARILLGVAALAVAVVLFVVLQDDGGDDTPAAVDRGQPATGRDEPRDRGSKPEKPAARSVPVITVRGGEPVGGVRTLEFEAGDRVRFEVRSDVADEVHVHGYDLSKHVDAGGSVEFDFPATIEGVFEAELEQRGTHILELRVNP